MNDIPKKLEREIQFAYADCWMANQNLSYELRCLDFCSSKFLSKEQAKYLFSKYVKSYNEFKPELLDYLPDDTQVKIAREGSVCVYVASKTLDSFSVAERNELRKVMKLDEFSKYNNEHRLWWD